MSPPAKINQFCRFAYRNIYNKSNILFKTNNNNRDNLLLLNTLENIYFSCPKTLFHTDSSTKYQIGKYTKTIDQFIRQIKLTIRNQKESNIVSNNTPSQTEETYAKLDFVGGLVKLTLFLPARREKCEFTLKLINDTVGSLIENIKIEDKSVEKVLVYTNDGVRIAQNTPIGLLVTQPFMIKINDSVYKIEPPESLLKRHELDSGDAQYKKDLDEVRQLVSKLYLHLNIEQYETEREQEIVKQLEQLKTEIQPMEKIREELALKAKKHTNRMIWLGLGMMSIQVGIMARLTWFDYSWDIVEPISYFVSYSAVIGVYAYFVLTRKEYDYESASDRIFLRHFHKNAIKNNLNVSKYNDAKNTIYFLENELKKIKDSQIKKYEDRDFQFKKT